MGIVSGEAIPKAYRYRKETNGVEVHEQVQARTDAVIPLSRRCWPKLALAFASRALFSLRVFALSVAAWTVFPLDLAVARTTFQTFDTHGYLPCTNN
jgi:hypothetical protein